MDIQFDYGYVLERFIWTFLPDSPGYSPDYIKEQGIKSVKTCVGRSRFNSYAFDDVSLFNDYHICADENYLSDVDFVVECSTYTREDYVEFFFMSYWLLHMANMGITDSPLKHNMELGKLDKPSTVFRKIYQDILNATDNKYALAMKELVGSIRELVNGERQDITDFRQFNLPWTDTSADLMYIHKCALILFEEEFIEFFTKIFDALNIEIKDEMVVNLRNNIKSWSHTSSPKFDNLYRIRTFYEEKLREKRIISS